MTKAHHPAHQHHASITLKNQILRSDDVKNIMHAMLENNITSLAIENCKINQKDIEYICASLQHKESCLQQVRIDQTILTPDQFNQLPVLYIRQKIKQHFQTLLKHKTIDGTEHKTLHIKDESLSTLEFEAIMHVVTEQQVTSLSLIECGLDTQNIALLSEKLNDNIALTQLELVDTIMVIDMYGDYEKDALLYCNDAIILAEGLRNNQCLKTLNLSTNAIGDKGAKAIAEALPFTQLTHVYLNDNEVGNQGADAFIAYFNSCQQSNLQPLEQLNLDDNKLICETKMQQLHQAKTLAQKTALFDRYGIPAAAANTTHLR